MVGEKKQTIETLFYFMTKQEFFQNNNRAHLVKFDSLQEAYEVFDYLKDHPLCKTDQIPTYEKQWEEMKSNCNFIGILYTSKNASKWDFIATNSPIACPMESEVISFREFNEMISSTTNSTITTKYTKKHL